MPRMRGRALAALLSLSLVGFTIAACDNGKGLPNGGTGGGGQMPGPDMAFQSACGRPGDKGNAKGVGKFCMTDDDCVGTEALICSTINNDTAPDDQKTYFCVK